MATRLSAISAPNVPSISATATRSRASASMLPDFSGTSSAMQSIRSRAEKGGSLPEMRLLVQ